jgi:hypothetical protein
MDGTEFNRRIALIMESFEKSRAEHEKRMAEFDIEREKRMAEYDRREEERREEAKEAKKRMEERMAEFDRKWDKIGEKSGSIDENIGSHAEQYFQNAFAEQPIFGGIKYDEMIPNVKHCDKRGEIEFDILLENGDSVALIEVKSRIHPKFVREFAEDRMEKFRKFFPQYAKYKAYLGIAGFSFGKKVLEEAKRYGIGIVRQSGKGVEIDTGKLKVY